MLGYHACTNYPKISSQDYCSSRKKVVTFFLSAVPMWSTGVDLPNGKASRVRNIICPPLRPTQSVGSGAIFDCTGGFSPSKGRHKVPDRKLWKNEYSS